MCTIAKGFPIGAVALAVAITACLDATRSTSTKQVTAKIERQDIDLAAGGTMSGKATTTIRMFDGRSLGGTFIAADTNAFQAAIAPTGASAARMTAGGKGIELLLAVGDNGTPARTGTWTVEGKRNKSVPKTTLTFVAAGGAPASEMTLRVGGKIVSRVATEWTRVRGGWVATARTTMLYRGGRLARSFTTTFDDPQGARIVYSSKSVPGQIALSEADNCIFKADAPCDGDPVLGGAGSAGYGGPCQSDIDGLKDAVTAYWAADASMIACLGGPLACAGATIAVLYTAHQIDVWDARVDACLAAL